VISHLSGCYSFLLVAQHPLDQILCLIGNIPPVIVYHADRACLRQLFDLFQKLGVEWKVSRQHEVQDDAQTKGIYFVVIVLSIVNLWSNEPWSSSKFLFWSQILEFILKDSKTKIDQFDSMHNLSFFVYLNLNY